MHVNDSNFRVSRERSHCFRRIGTLWSDYANNVFTFVVEVVDQTDNGLPTDVAAIVSYDEFQFVVG